MYVHMNVCVYIWMYVSMYVCVCLQCGSGNTCHDLGIRTWKYRVCYKAKISGKLEDLWMVTTDSDAAAKSGPGSIKCVGSAYCPGKISVCSISVTGSPFSKLTADSESSSKSTPGWDSERKNPDNYYKGYFWTNVLLLTVCPPLQGAYVFGRSTWKIFLRTKKVLGTEIFRILFLLSGIF